MKLTIQDGRDSFYTFDSNRILLLTATDEEQIKQVEFSTEEAGGTETWTKDVLEQEDGVKYVQVPNEFLNGDYTRLVCYAVALDSKGEFTRQKEVFRIKYRPQPEDWFLTYSERVTFASIKALTEQYKSNASDSAELASKYAENNEDVAVESGKYSAKHWSIKSNKKYEEIRSYVGSASDPESALGSIESARANAVSDVEKQETDSIEAVGTYTSNTAIPSVSQYVEGTAKPALKTYGEQQVDSYVNGTSKPELDRYVNNDKKQVLDEYTAEKKTELDIYTSVDKKQVLDSYTENEKKTELDSHTVGLKEQLDAHTVAKAGDLNEHTTSLKGTLDGYTTAKEQEISEFTEQKKQEVQGVYQSDLNELKGDLVDIEDRIKNVVNSKYRCNWRIGGYFLNDNTNPPTYSATAGTAEQRICTNEYFEHDTDVKISLSDYTNYRYTYVYYDEVNQIYVDSQWKKVDTSFRANEKTKLWITVAYVTEDKPDLSDAYDNDLFKSLSIVSANDFEGISERLSIAEENASEALEKSKGAVSEKTKNLVENQPVFGNTSFLCVDFGKDVTFENGIVISFDANDLVLTGLTSDIFTLRKNDGSNLFIVGNDFYSYEGNHLTISKANGRYASHKREALKSNVTFRYLYINYSSSRVSNGTITNLMLESGNTPTPFVPHITGIDYIARTSVDDLKDSLSEYPDYWDNAIKTAISTIQSKQVNISSGDSFFFVTDQHWDSNAQKSSMLIDYLSRKLHIPTIVSGGDIIKSHNTSLVGAFDEIRNYYDSFKCDGFTRLLSTIGNHDLNINNNSDTSTYISMVNLYNLMMKNCEVFTNTDGNPYGIVYDNESQKVRYIQFYYCGDSGYNNQSANWLDTTLKATESGWTVILFSHAYWNGENVDSAGTMYANLILSAMDEMSATVALWLVGHNHNDRSTTLTSNGGKTLLIVSTTTDAIGQKPPYTMTYGTDTEQAFDVVTIDTSAKKIYFTRVGAGSDREFSY